MLPLARVAPTDIETILVELPGRGARFCEPFDTDFRALCARLAEGVLAWSDKPAVLFGHSMGGNIAYEVAGLLQERFSRSPEALVVSACHPPGCLDGLPRTERATDLELLAQLRHYGGTPAEVFQSPELLDIVLTVLRQDLALLGTVPRASREPLDCPIVAFGGAADTSVSEFELRRWGEFTLRGFVQTTFPGGHFYLTEDARQVFNVLSQILNGARR